MVRLDNSVRLVALQFSFSNPNAVPQVVKRAERETPDEWNERKSRASGTMVVEPTENCSIVEFLGELEAAGYEMVDAFYKERIDPKDPWGRRTYRVVCFLFARHEFVDLSVEFKGVRDDVRAALTEMCRVAMWRVRVFSNPFYQNGLEVPDQRAVSINLKARQPLFRLDGQPVTVWQKDERGKRIGDAPLPLKPRCCLRLVSDAVQLVTA